MDEDTKWVGEALSRRLQGMQDEAFLGPMAFTEAPSPPASELKTEDLMALMGRMRAEQRWLYGRPVRAFKVGRAELAYCRQHMERNTTYASIAPLYSNSLFGIPFYEVDRPSYLETIYQDEAPTLEVLNERLMQEPAAVWGQVTQGVE